MRKSQKRLAVFGGAALAATSTLFAPAISSAALNTWTGTNSGNWSDPGNWSGTAPPPQNGDSVLFPGATSSESTTDDIASLSLAGLSFSGADSYTVAGSNAIALTGGATALVNGSSNLQAISAPLSYAAATTFNGGTGAGAGLAISGPVTNTAASGSVVLTLLGVGTISDNFVNGSAGTSIITPNAATANWTISDNPTSTAITLPSGQINVVNGTLNYGTATSAPNFTVTTAASDHTIGNSASTGTFNMVNGTLLLKTRLNTVNGNLNVSGGDLQVWNQFQESNGAVANISTVTVSNGLVDIRNSTGSTAGGTFFVASRGQGTLTMSGGSLLCSTLDVSRGASAAVSGVASQGVVNLNGGTISCNLVSTASANTSGTGAGATALLNLNGGTLKAKQNKASTGLTTGFISQSAGSGTNVPISVIVKSGGAIIDSNAFAIGTSEALMHDPSLGATPDGGLTKIDSGATPGSLTLLGVNTYTGPTVVKVGTLAIGATGSIANSAKIIVGDVAADAAAKLDVTAISLFHVVSGQTLGGYGTVLAGATGIAEDSGSTVSPGDTIGALSITGNDTLAGTLLVEQNDADPGIIDQLNVSGAFDISAPTAGVNFSVTGTPAQSAYIFARYGSLIGTSFASTSNIPAGYTIDYDYQGNNDIALVAVPEPASLGLLGVATLGLLARRRSRRT